MNLTDVIAEIDEKYPNGLDVSSKVRKADIIQKRIYRILKKQNFVSYDLLTDQAEYPLTVEMNSVFQVDVRNVTSGKYCRYPLRKVLDITNDCSKYYYFTSDPGIGDWIGLYPTPTVNEDLATIYYYEVPGSLSDISSTITLYENYRMMLVYGVCKEIAENYRDTDNATGFAIQYNALESELLGLGRSSDVLTVRNGMGW